MDMFAGSGTHAEACILEGMQFIAIEKDAVNRPDIEHRIARAKNLGKYSENYPCPAPAASAEESESAPPAGQLGLSL